LPMNPPRKYKQLIEAYREFSSFTPIFTPTGFRDGIVQHLSRDAEYLITTRIDNDDAFHRDAVSVIQQHFTGQELEFLNFPLGYEYTYPGNDIFLKVRLSNAFIGFVEKLTREPFKTVRCGHHGHLREVGPIKQIDSAPYWLQVIHEKNMSNVVKGTPCSAGDLRESFGITNER
jgi:hypothetical protein